MLARTIRSLRPLRSVAGALLLAGCAEPLATTPVDLPEGPGSTRTYRSGPVLYLETAAGRDTARLAVGTHWGGSIIEVSLNGTNFVNAFDPGREIQLSLYDGAHLYDDCAGCTRRWGWNPVQGGDLTGSGSTVLEARHEADALVVRVRPNEWFPENKGGGPGRPVPSDIILEQRISGVPGHPRAFRVDYHVRHLGADRHLPHDQQEFPALYANREYSRLVHYAGHRPWTDDRVTTSALPMLFSQPRGRVYAAEGWGSFVDKSGNGLTIYAPGSFPYLTGWQIAGPTGPTGGGANYMYPFTPFGIEPNAEVRGTFFLIAGDYRAARAAVYALRRTFEAPDLAYPIGELDRPANGAVVRGVTRVEGWAYDNVGVRTVEVFVDGAFVAHGGYGRPRPDVVRRWEGASADVGYALPLDTRRLSNGPHTLEVRVYDRAGNRSDRRATIQVRN